MKITRTGLQVEAICLQITGLGDAFVDGRDRMIAGQVAILVSGDSPQRIEARFRQLQEPIIRQKLSATIEQLNIFSRLMDLIRGGALGRDAAVAIVIAQGLQATQGRFNLSGGE